MPSGGQDEKNDTTPLPLRIGYALTAVWLAFIVSYFGWNWSHVRGLPANEMGDFLAGAAAPLAFLWLVVAVFLQKEELSLQRAELQQSRLALHRQADETAALVKQNMEAVRIAQRSLELQMRQIAEVRSDNLIQILAELVQDIRPRLHVKRHGKDRPVFGRPDGPDIRHSFRAMHGGLREWANTKEECEFAGPIPAALAVVRLIRKNFERLLALLDTSDAVQLEAKVTAWGLKSIAADLRNFESWLEGMSTGTSD